MTTAALASLFVREDVIPGEQRQSEFERAVLAGSPSSVSSSSRVAPLLPLRRRRFPRRRIARKPSHLSLRTSGRRSGGDGTSPVFYETVVAQTHRRATGDSN